MIDAVAKASEAFIGLFQEGGEYFSNLVVSMIPTLLVLLTFINMIMKLIGEDRVMRFMKKCTRFAITRYTLLPLVSMIFMTDPMCLTMGKFVDEKYKTAFYDSTISLAHSITGVFPHANAMELFVFNGIATGVAAVGLNSQVLAVWYLLTSLVVIFIRGMLTERIFILLDNRRKKKLTLAEEVN